MKRLARIIILVLFPVAVFSQKEYFIYLQSEGEQPFFVRMANETFNSSPAGHLILSKLKDTSHTFKVGFPQNKWPDQLFTVAIRSGDHGYLLKNFGEKGWGLFDLQTMSVQMSSGNTAAKKPVSSGVAVVSAFTEILSKAANDPGLKEKPVYAVVKEQPENVQQVAPKSAPVAVKEPPKEVVSSPADTSSKKEELIAKQEPAAPPVDTKKKSDSLRLIAAAEADMVAKTEADVSKTTDTSKAQAEEVTMAADPAVKKEDTAITISPKNEPAETGGKTNPVVSTEVANPPASPDYDRSEVIKKSESSTTEGFGLVFIDKIGDWRQDTIQLMIPNPKAPEEPAKSRLDDKKFLDIGDEDAQAAVKKGLGKNECAYLASENDFFKLRKRMAGQKEDESMINEAKKDFKSKCFSVDQIRNLGNLFLNEAGKFQFYEAAYPTCSDKTGFAVLETEFKDPYFVHRFKNFIK